MTQPTGGKPAKIRIPNASQHQIGVALAQETRAWARKRLIALDTLLAGEDLWAAAFASKSTPESIRWWLRQAKAGGLRGLLSNSRVSRPYRLGIPPERVSGAKKEIDTLLRTERRAWARSRLLGVRLLLSGVPLRTAARRVDKKSDTVSNWFRSWRDGGNPALLSKPPRGPQLPAMNGREMARIKEAVTRLLNRHPKPDAPSQQRLRALLIALSGNIDEAADAAFVHTATVRRWLRTVHDQGATALLEKRHTGRPRRRSGS